MDSISTLCPGCANPLDFPIDAQNLICVRCGATFKVTRHDGAIGLSRIALDSGGGLPSMTEEALDLDEQIERLTFEIDALRSREQGAPLQAGCTLFGIFCLAISAIAIFMTVGRSYFGRWPFYLTLAVVFLLGLLRIRRSLAGDEIASLRAQRASLEADLGALQTARAQNQDSQLPK